MELRFDSEKIDALEAISGKSFLSMLASMKIGNMLLFVQKGADCKTKREACELLDNYLKKEEDGGEGGSYPKLNQLIMTSLQDAGFLDREVDLQNPQLPEGTQNSAQVQDIVKSILE